MQLFDITEAEHFCRPLPGFTPGLGQSLDGFHRNLTARSLIEGTAPFDIHRVSLLNAVERWILFGTAHYRRALDMFIPSNAPWAHVTLYYSSFFAANALLGMFGVWIHLQRWVDVQTGTPNNQVLKINRNPRGPSGFGGSHQNFWDFFYEGCNSIAGWVPPELTEAVTPVNNDRKWQITARNEVNYDMSFAFDASLALNDTFNPKRLREFGGALGQQLEVTEAMLKLAIHFANDFGLNSYAYSGLADGVRPKMLRSLVSKVPPSVVNQSIIQELFQ
jgi:hypothetical protein